jgi:transposase
MAAPYSIDLRERVLAECDKKEIKRFQIAEIFKVDLKTIYNWLKARKASGTIEPKSGYQKGHSHKITDTEKFKAFIAANPNLSLKELSRKWGGVSSTTIGNKLHNIGYTVKKNSGDIKNVMNKKGLNIWSRSQK